MLDPINVWQEEFSSLAQTDGTGWAQEYASLVGRLVNGKLEAQGISPPSTFTFNQAIFAAQLLTLQPVPDAALGALAFGNAWLAAITSSTMLVAPGSSLGAPSPATTWATVASLLNPGATSIAHLKLVEALTNAKPVEDPEDSPFVIAFREAFLGLATDAIGVNTVAPTPAPLVAMMVGSR